MQNKNIKIYISFFSVVIAGVFFSFHQASAQDGLMPDNDPTTEPNVVFVQVNVLDTYCRNDAGFGKVSFVSEPSDGAMFQISGTYLSGTSAVYTFHPGEYELPIGVYTWNALPTSDTSDTSPEPSLGKFTIHIECDNADGNTTNDSNQDSDSTDTASDTTLDDGGSGNDSDDTTDVNDDTNTSSATAPDLPAVSAVNSNGIEGQKTPAKYPLAEEGEENGGTDDPALTTNESTDILSGETEPTATTNDDITTSDTSIIRSVLSGTHVLFLETQYADSIEWYIKREPGDTFKYLGAATLNKENSMWEYVWDTMQVPNGDYVLVPKIRSDLGKEYKDTPSYITVKNKEEGSVGTKDATLINDVKKAIPQIVRVDEETREAEDIAKENIIDVTTPYYDKVQEYINNDQSTALEKKEFIREQERSKEYLRRLLDVESSKLLDSAFDGDEEKKEHIREKIIMASNNSLDRIDKIARKLGIELSDKELELIREERRMKMAEFEKIIEEKKEILRGRVGHDVFEDSDKDGISNYDEINIYDTDPFDADSDDDGYVDGAEIIGGFNPKDPSVEAVILYEEPTTAGYVEEEIFSVDSISVEEIEIDENGKEKAKKVSFQGTAPANSFVTLYIYSTPIIVTVKTDENGNWSYVLDKELEDGKHEIHVAITDNAGKIFAKSKPLPFIKEAAAITINDGFLLGGDNTEISVFDGKYLYIIILLIIVIIGWVLIRTGSKREELEENING